jgi:prepilin-type N-terminal cleavage/methylation domain-containing protein
LSAKQKPIPLKRNFAPRASNMQQPTINKAGTAKTSHVSSFKLQGRGFTLIELLIVIVISAMFSAFIITYSSVSRNEIALSVEAQKISQLILQAKSLAIATYGSSSAVCGYGFDFNNQLTSYSIFTYTPSAALPCPDVSKITSVPSSAITKWQSSAWNVPLAQGLVVRKQSDSLNFVLFYPPDPTILMSRVPQGAGVSNPTTAPAKIYLSTSDGKDSITITVNPGGQVTF